MINKRYWDYKYILLDWDGCLAKTLDIWMEGYQETFPLYNLHPSEHEIVEKCYGKWDGPKSFGIEDVDGFYKKLMLVIESKLEAVLLYSGAKDLFQELKARGKKLVILTTSERRYVQKAIEHHNLTKFVDHLFAGDEVKKHKPDPEPIYKGLLTVGGNLMESIIVGDSDKDVLAGRNAGTDSVLFLPEENKRFYNEAELLSLKPTYVIDQFDQLLKIV